MTAAIPEIAEMKNHLTDYIESKGFTQVECRKEAPKRVPDFYLQRHPDATYEEYLADIHEFINGI